MAVEFDVKGTRTSEYLGVPLKRALRVLFARVRPAAGRDGVRGSP